VSRKAGGKRKKKKAKKKVHLRKMGEPGIGREGKRGGAKSEKPEKGLPEWGPREKRRTARKKKEARAASTYLKTQTNGGRRRETRRPRMLSDWSKKSQVPSGAGSVVSNTQIGEKKNQGEIAGRFNSFSFTGKEQGSLILELLGGQKKEERDQKEAQVIGGR